MIDDHGRRAEPRCGGDGDRKARLIDIGPRHTGKPQGKPLKIVPVLEDIAAHRDVCALHRPHGVNESRVKQLTANERVQAEENHGADGGFGTLHGNLFSMTWEPGLYDAVHSYVSSYGKSLVELLAPQPGERILDLGCGTGTLTSEIASSGAVVTGVDSSPEMIGQARQSYPRVS